jgi:hypothetical protein
MSSSKKLICKWILRQVFICLRPRTSYPPTPLQSLYKCIQYTYSHREGGGGELNQRVGETATGESADRTQLG